MQNSVRHEESRRPRTDIGNTYNSKYYYTNPLGGNTYPPNQNQQMQPPTPVNCRQNYPPHDQVLYTDPADSSTYSSDPKIQWAIENGYLKHPEPRRPKNDSQATVDPKSPRGSPLHRDLGRNVRHKYNAEITPQTQPKMGPRRPENFLRNPRESAALTANSLEILQQEVEEDAITYEIEEKDTIEEIPRADSRFAKQAHQPRQPSKVSKTFVNNQVNFCVNSPPVPIAPFQQINAFAKFRIPSPTDAAKFAYEPVDDTVWSQKPQTKISKKSVNSFTDVDEFRSLTSSNCPEDLAALVRYPKEIIRAAGIRVPKHLEQIKEFFTPHKAQEKILRPTTPQKLEKTSEEDSFKSSRGSYVMQTAAARPGKPNRYKPGNVSYETQDVNDKPPHGGSKVLYEVEDDRDSNFDRSGTLTHKRNVNQEFHKSPSSEFQDIVGVDNYGWQQQNANIKHGKTLHETQDIRGPYKSAKALHEDQVVGVDDLSPIQNTNFKYGGSQALYNVQEVDNEETPTYKANKKHETYKSELSRYEGQDCNDDYFGRSGMPPNAQIKHGGPKSLHEDKKIGKRETLQHEASIKHAVPDPYENQDYFGKQVTPPKAKIKHGGSPALYETQEVGKREAPRHEVNIKRAPPDPCENEEVNDDCFGRPATPPNAKIKHGGSTASHEAQEVKRKTLRHEASIRHDYYKSAPGRYENQGVNDDDLGKPGPPSSTNNNHGRSKALNEAEEVRDNSFGKLEMQRHKTNTKDEPYRSPPTRYEDQDVSDDRLCKPPKNANIKHGDSKTLYEAEDGSFGKQRTPGQKEIIKHDSKKSAPEPYEDQDVRDDRLGRPGTPQKNSNIKHVGPKALYEAQESPTLRHNANIKRPALDPHEDDFGRPGTPPNTKTKHGGSKAVYEAEDVRAGKPEMPRHKTSVKRPEPDSYDDQDVNNEDFGRSEAPRNAKIKHSGPRAFYESQDVDKREMPRHEGNMKRPGPDAYEDQDINDEDFGRAEAPPNAKIKHGGLRALHESQDVDKRESPRNETNIKRPGSDAYEDQDINDEDFGRAVAPPNAKIKHGGLRALHESQDVDKRETPRREANIKRPRPDAYEEQDINDEDFGREETPPNATIKHGGPRASYESQDVDKRETPRREANIKRPRPDAYEEQDINDEDFGRAETPPNATIKHGGLRASYESQNDKRVMPRHEVKRPGSDRYEDQNVNDEDFGRADPPPNAKIKHDGPRALHEAQDVGKRERPRHEANIKRPEPDPYEDHDDNDDDFGKPGTSPMAKMEHGGSKTLAQDVGKRGTPRREANIKRAAPDPFEDQDVCDDSLSRPETPPQNANLKHKKIIKRPEPDPYEDHDDNDDDFGKPVTSPMAKMEHGGSKTLAQDVGKRGTPQREANIKRAAPDPFEYQDICDDSLSRPETPPQYVNTKHSYQNVRDSSFDKEELPRHNESRKHDSHKSAPDPYEDQDIHDEFFGRPGTPPQNANLKHRAQDVRDGNFSKLGTPLHKTSIKQDSSKSASDPYEDQDVKHDGFHKSRTLSQNLNNKHGAQTVKDANFGKSGTSPHKAGIKPDSHQTAPGHGSCDKPPQNADTKHDGSKLLKTKDVKDGRPGTLTHKAAIRNGSYKSEDQDVSDNSFSKSTSSTRKPNVQHGGPKTLNDTWDTGDSIFGKLAKLKTSPKLSSDKPKKPLYATKHVSDDSCDSPSVTKSVKRKPQIHVDHSSTKPASPTKNLRTRTKPQEPEISSKCSDDSYSKYQRNKRTANSVRKPAVLKTKYSINGSFTKPSQKQQDDTKILVKSPTKQPKITDVSSSRSTSPQRVCKPMISSLTAKQVAKTKESVLAKEIPQVKPSPYGKKNFISANKVVAKAPPKKEQGVVKKKPSEPTPPPTQPKVPISRPKTAPDATKVATKSKEKAKTANTSTTTIEKNLVTDVRSIDTETKSICNAVESSCQYDKEMENKNQEEPPRGDLHIILDKIKDFQKTLEKHKITTLDSNSSIPASIAPKKSADTVQGFLAEQKLIFRVTASQRTMTVQNTENITKKSSPDLFTREAKDIKLHRIDSLPCDYKKSTSPHEISKRVISLNKMQTLSAEISRKILELDKVANPQPYTKMSRKPLNLDELQKRSREVIQKITNFDQEELKSPVIREADIYNDQVQPQSLSEKLKMNETEIDKEKRKTKEEEPKIKVDESTPQKIDKTNQMSQEQPGVAAYVDNESKNNFLESDLPSPFALSKHHLYENNQMNAIPFKTLEARPETPRNNQRPDSARSTQTSHELEDEQKQPESPRSTQTGHQLEDEQKRPESPRNAQTRHEPEYEQKRPDSPRSTQTGHELEDEHKRSESPRSTQTRHEPEFQQKRPDSPRNNQTRFELEDEQKRPESPRSTKTPHEPEFEQKRPESPRNNQTQHELADEQKRPESARNAQTSHEPEYEQKTPEFSRNSQNLHEQNELEFDQKRPFSSSTKQRLHTIEQESSQMSSESLQLKQNQCDNNEDAMSKITERLDTIDQIFEGVVGKRPKSRKSIRRIEDAEDRPQSPRMRQPSNNSDQIIDIFQEATTTEQNPPHSSRSKRKHHTNDDKNDASQTRQASPKSQLRFDEGSKRSASTLPSKSKRRIDPTEKEAVLSEVRQITKKLEHEQELLSKIKQRVMDPGEHQALLSEMNQRVNSIGQRQNQHSQPLEDASPVSQKNVNDNKHVKKNTTKEADTKIPQAKDSKELIQVHKRQPPTKTKKTKKTPRVKPDAVPKPPASVEVQPVSSSSCSDIESSKKPIRTSRASSPIICKIGAEDKISDTAINDPGTVAKYKHSSKSTLTFGESVSEKHKRPHDNETASTSRHNPKDKEKAKIKKSGKSKLVRKEPDTLVHQFYKYCIAILVFFRNYPCKYILKYLLFL